MASVDSTDLIQLIFREKNKSLKIFGIFCFKDLTFYGGDIAGRNPAVGFIRSEAPWSSANSLAAADLVMEWDDIGWHWMTLDDIQWKMEIMEITELETWHPPSQIQVDCGHLRKIVKSPSHQSMHEDHFRWRHKCCCRWVPWKYSELPQTSEIFLQTI